MAERALVLVARPTPSGIDERSLRTLAAAVAERSPLPVHVAHLDQAEPSIHAVLDELADGATRTVLLVPLAVPADRYLASWIGKAVANWHETRGDDLDVRTTEGLTALPAVADAIAALGDGVPVTASPAAFRSPAWSVLEIPQRHLLVCRGPRCTAYGAGATHRALAAAATGTTTQVTPIGCVGPCNLGPLVIDHPAGTWHQEVDETRATALIEPRHAT
ncbi:MAG: (2Fe-2S) ferredoxin domain-containing protein [Pseudonocardia sp.]